MVTISEAVLKNYFDTHLKQSLEKLQAGKFGVLLSVIITRTYQMLFVTTVFSLFIDFLSIFPFDEFHMGWVTVIFKSFFYGILGFIILGISRNKIKKEVISRYPRLNKPWIINGLMLLSGIFIFGVSYQLGKYYLGNEMAFNFFLKYAGAILFLVILFLPMLLLGRVENNFKNKYRRELLSRLILLFDKKAHFTDESGIERKDFFESMLFPAQEIFGYEASKLISSKNEKTNFQFCLLDVTSRKVERSGAKTEVKIEKLFKGIFYKADFNKKLQGVTVVVPDLVREIFGSAGEMLNRISVRPDMKLVMLENPEFESMFAVYSTDQVEARYVLSPSMLERMVMMRKKFRNDLYFSFVKQQLFVAIPSDSNVLMPSIFANIASFETVQPIAILLQNIFAIVDDLELNTRLWPIESANENRE